MNALCKIIDCKSYITPALKKMYCDNVIMKLLKCLSRAFITFFAIISLYSHLLHIRHGGQVF